MEPIHSVKRQEKQITIFYLKKNPNLHITLILIPKHLQLNE